MAISAGCVRLLRHVVPRNDKKGMLIAMTGGDVPRNDIIIKGKGGSTPPFSPSPYSSPFKGEKYSSPSLAGGS